MGIEHSAPGAMSKQEPRAPHSSLPQRRLDAKAFAPLPFQVLWGLITLKVNYTEETRRWLAPDRKLAAGGLRALGTGVLYLPHAKEGKPHAFAAFELFGATDFKRQTPPMVEFSVGAFMDDYDVPWLLAPEPTDQTVTRLELRWRRFPGFDRWLPLLGHLIEQKSGLVVDLYLPLHGLVGWKFPAEAGRAYGGYRISLKAFPSTKIQDIDDADDGWYEGYSINLLVGMRLRLDGPFFASVETGLTRETLSLYDHEGQRLFDQTTHPMPYVRMGLETWIKHP